MSDSADPFGTELLRGHVLAAWSASPARLREDANAEEDLALGAYRDRLVVELAQNAADAAARAGSPGRLLLRRNPDRLVAANTGAALDAAGVQGLATLRASAKDAGGGSVGRFGVGFAAVLAVTDEPAVASRAAAGVRFSRSRTQAAAGAEHVPVLRLPWPERVDVPDGYDTVVELPLRDERAAALLDAQLDAVTGVLLLVLPWLDEVVVESAGRQRVLRAHRHDDEVVVRLDGVGTRWRLHESHGALDPALLADRPTEERARRGWSLTWAVALRGEAPGQLVVPPPGVPAVLHAPTPSDEPLVLPGVLVGSFPLDPGRRHVAAGALSEHLVAEAGLGYARLAGLLAAEGVDVAPLVPAAAAVHGALDTLVRRAVLAALRAVPLLPAADGAHLLRPQDAVAVEGADAPLAAVLAPVVSGLARPGWPAPALRALGVRRLALADVVDELAGVAREPRWWRELYDALSGCGAGPDELGGLPVPLVDGRSVRGLSGVLLPGVGRGGRGGGGDGVPVAAMSALGVRVVHPDAVHPLLERLGARPATVAEVLGDASVAAALRAEALDGDGDGGGDGDGDGGRDGAPYGDRGAARAVLELLAADVSARGPWSFSDELLLPDEDGEPAHVDELVLPGSAAEGLLDGLRRVAPDLVREFGPEVLTRAGVVAGLSPAALSDVELDDALADALGDPGVDGLLDWVDDVHERLGVGAGDLPPHAASLVLVRDLDLIPPHRWVQALRLLGAPPLRDAVLEPVRVVTGDGRRRDVPSYAAWWVSQHAVIDGAAPGALRLSGTDPLLAGVYRALEPPQGVDPELLRGVGVRTSLAGLLQEPGGPDDLLERLPGAELGGAQLRAVYAALAAASPHVQHAPALLRVPDGAGSRVLDADDVVVADSPQWLQLPWSVPPLAARDAERLADALDVDLASQRRPGTVTSAGTPAAAPAPVRAVLPAAPEQWVEHDELTVDGAPVDWWVDADGTVHAATTDGLAAGLAWSAGAWSRRFLVAAVLAEPERLPALLADAAWDTVD